MTAKATLRQIEILRAIKAAQKAGVPRVVLPNGVSIEISDDLKPSPKSTEKPSPAPKDFVL